MVGETPSGFRLRKFRRRVKIETDPSPVSGGFVFTERYMGDPIVSLNPLGSVTSKTRLPQSVSCASVSSEMPAFFARSAS